MVSAIIVGATGQDGTYLYETLNDKGYWLFGIGRQKIITNHHYWKRHTHINICEFSSVSEIIKEIQPDEIYHLAAIHHSSQDTIIDYNEFVRGSFNVNVLSLNFILEAIRLFSPKTKLFYAASSHIFGNPNNEPQDEKTIINPQTLYGITKATGLYMCRMYRSTYNVHASVGILYNHESRFRGEQFVSQKIVKGATKCLTDPNHKIILGDLKVAVDWGFAPDYVVAMQKILQLSYPDDFIIATGEKHTVEEFVRIAFNILGLEWHKHIIEKKSILTRPTAPLIGNPEKLIKHTGWRRTVTFPEMIKILLKEAGDSDDL